MMKSSKLLVSAVISAVTLMPHTSISAEIAGITVPDEQYYSDSRFRCPSTLEAMPVNTTMPSPFVQDGNYDKYNPVTLAQYNTARKPFDAARYRIAKLSELYITGYPWVGAPIRRPGDASMSDCSIKLLNNWATSGALLGSISDQGRDYVRFIMPSVAMGYLLAKGDRTDLSATTVSKINTWLKKVNDIDINIMQYRAEVGTANNHLYWVGYTAMLIGIATNDTARFNWGVEAIRYGLNAINPHGLLPREVLRNTRALHYHAFALQALSMGVLVMQANGISLTTLQSQRLNMLGQTVVNGFNDPAYFIKLVANDFSTIKLPTQVIDDTADELSSMEPQKRLYPFSEKFAGAYLKYGEFDGDNFGPSMSILFSLTN